MFPLVGGLVFGLPLGLSGGLILAALLLRFLLGVGRRRWRFLLLLLIGGGRGWLLLRFFLGNGSVLFFLGLKIIEREMRKKFIFV